MRSPKNKILLWLVILALIMACAPAMAAPAPTLEPNTINTLIMQTAAAAATQTVAAVPVFTSTATFTVTPPNTFTPESTFTAVGTILFPTPTPIAREQYFRVRHDNQLAIYNFRSRTADPNWPNETWGLQTPEVFRMLVGLGLSLGTNRTTVDGNWGKYIDALNDYNPKKITYLKANNSALFNGAGYPQMESLTMGGNIITADEQRNGWVRVHTIDYNNPGALKEVNYVTRPDLIHKFVVVGWNRSKKVTYFVNPPPGDLYWPLVSSLEVWMPLEYLEGFPQLPMTVTANTTQAIRNLPAIDSLKTGFEVAKDRSVSVVEYHASGSDVWGRLAGGGWIPLLAHQKGLPLYPTSWSMVTQPPP